MRQFQQFRETTNATLLRRWSILTIAVGLVFGAIDPADAQRASAPVGYVVKTWRKDGTPFNGQTIVVAFVTRDKQEAIAYREKIKSYHRLSSTLDEVNTESNLASLQNQLKQNLAAIPKKNTLAPSAVVGQWNSINNTPGWEVYYGFREDGTWWKREMRPYNSRLPKGPFEGITEGKWVVRDNQIVMTYTDDRVYPYAPILKGDTLEDRVEGNYGWRFIRVKK